MLQLISIYPAGYARDLLVVREQGCLPSSIFSFLYAVDDTKPQFPHLFNGDNEAFYIFSQSF